MHEISHFELQGVTLEASFYNGVSAFKMCMPRSAIQDPQREALTDRDFMAWIPMDFTNGINEVDVAADLVASAPVYCRGFIGVTFRIDRRGASRASTCDR